MPLPKRLSLFMIALASAFPTRPATGSLTIISNCPYDVYIQICPADCCITHADGTVTCPPWLLLPPATAGTIPFSQFSSAVNSSGVSIKMGTGGPSITQLELGSNVEAGQMFYDISNLNNKDENGNVVPGPFENDGLVVWADQAASQTFPNCQTIHCAAGEAPCTDGYWIGETVDRYGESISNHIMACSDTANLFLDLCSG